MSFEQPIGITRPPALLLQEQIEAALRSEVVPRPELSEFVDVYGEEEVARDEKNARSMKRRHEDSIESVFEKLQRKVAEAFEAAVASVAHAYLFFGSDAAVVRMPVWEDQRGTDMVLEFPPKSDDDAPVPLVGIDVTISNSLEVVKEKLLRGLARVTGDFRPNEVKYFESQIGNRKKGVQRDIVPVVIGADRENIRVFFKTLRRIEEWRERAQSATEETAREEAKREVREEKERLRLHPIQGVFLNQLILQFAWYERELRDQVRRAEMGRSRALKSWLEGEGGRRGYIGARRMLECVTEVRKRVEEVIREKEHEGITPEGEDAVTELMRDIIAEHTEVPLQQAGN